jgi:hypothetical protein
MDPQKAYTVALDHYRKGNDLLNWPVAVLIGEQALHVARASAHFGAGTLALALARAAHDGLGTDAAAGSADAAVAPEGA